MGKRRVFLILIGLVIAGAVVVLATREREPEYQGKKLSEWVVELTAYTSDAEIPQRATDDAVRHIGTNAIPYLLIWLQYEPPAWKVRVHDMVDPVLQRFPLTAKLTDRMHQCMAMAAARCLGSLGPEANAAIPALRHIENDPEKPAARSRAMAVLVSLGVEVRPQ